MYCIYKITNLINGKTYIGQHKYKDLNDSYMGSGIHIKRAIRKYGIENFKKEILYSNIQYKETVDDMERFAIAKERAIGKAEYNIADGGEGGGCKGYHHTEEARKRISEANKGRHLSEEIKRKISEAKKGKPNGNKGKPKSLEHKRKIGKAHKGIHFSEEARKKISEAKKGKHISEEVLKRRSETVKGKHWYNNGTKNIWSKTCPEGFVPGRINYVRSSTLHK